MRDTFEQRVVSASVQPEIFKALHERAVQEHSSASAIIRRALQREFFDVPVSPGEHRPEIYGKRTGAGRPRRETSSAA